MGCDDIPIASLLHPLYLLYRISTASPLAIRYSLFAALHRARRPIIRR